MAQDAYRINSDILSLSSVPPGRGAAPARWRVLVVQDMRLLGASPLPLRVRDSLAYLGVRENGAYRLPSL